MDTGQTVSATSGSFTNVSATSNLTVGGNSTLGDAPTDTITFTGSVNSNIIPSGTRELGSSSAPWEKLYVNDLDIADDLQVDSDLQVDGNAGVTGTATIGTLAVSGAATINGAVDIDGAITRDGGNVLFDTDGILNQATIATGAITSAKLASVVTGATVGTASRIPVFTFNNKGQITAATDVPNGGVQSFAVGNGADGKKFTITTADGSTFDATVGAGSIGTNELTTISGLTATTYGLSLIHI